MALSGPRPQTTRLGEETLPPMLKVPVAASVKIWAGAMVMLDAGYAKPAAAAVGKVVLGRAESTVDNTTGSAGDLTVVVRRGVHKWANSGSGDLIAQAQVGTICYAVDDQTVAKTSNSGARSAAGTVVQVESDGVFVQQGLMSQSELDAISEAQAAAVVTLTDNTGGSGTHDDTLADGLNSTAPASITGYTALTNYTDPVTKAQGEALSAAHALLVLEVTALRATVATMQSDAVIQNQNASDLAQKVIEILARMVTLGLIAA